MLRTADLVVARPPDANWIINVIGILEPNHEIFARDYVPPRAVVDRIVMEPQIENNDQFFNDLPQLTPQQMKARAFAMPKTVQLR